MPDVQGRRNTAEKNARRRARWAETSPEVAAGRRARWAARTDEQRAYDRERAAARRAQKPESYREYDRQRKERALVMRGKRVVGRCLRCGYDRYLGALEWHHVEPDEKEAEPSWLLRKSDAVALAELSKCVLICVNCHRETHAGLWAPTLDMAEIVHRALLAEVAA